MVGIQDILREGFCSFVKMFDCIGVLGWREGFKYCVEFLPIHSLNISIANFVGCLDGKGQGCVVGGKFIDNFPVGDLLFDGE